MLLKKTLLANAVFSFTCGLLMLLLPGPIASLLGSVPAWILMALGVGLIIFAADVFWVSSKLPRSLPWARAIFWADIVWVVLTPLVLWVFAAAFSRLGVFIAIDIAVIVALFAWVEWKGLQELGQEFA